MIAIEISDPGGPDVLKAVERPTPVPAAGEVLVRVEAAGVNRPDLMQRLGKYPPPPGASDIPGLEIAGVVERADRSDRWQAGDRVCALVAGGGYAEYCAVPAVQCLPIPNGMDSLTAAAIPETFFTVWTNLFQDGRLQPGEHVLVHGGTGGIGSTAIQLARALGATVYATAGSDEKCRACERIGATAAFNYRQQDFVAEIQSATGGGGVDVVLDIVGGDYLPRNIQCLRRKGRLVQVSLMGGSKGELDLGAVLWKHLTITGSTLRPRTPEEKGAIARELEAQVWPLLERHEVAPIVHTTFPLIDASEAHRLLESGEVMGKLVLRVQAQTKS
jgi:NADPH2:quinone reductase